jgi:hypothetical protein
MALYNYAGARNVAPVKLFYAQYQRFAAVISPNYLQNPMKKIAYACLIALSIVACKKKDNETTNENEPAGFTVPGTTGSYWVYSCSKIDSMGVETALGITDTVTLVGTETFGGHTWLKYEGTQFGADMDPWYERDSSGYIVNSHGTIVYSYSSPTTTFSTTGDMGFSFQHQMSGGLVIGVPAGSFAVLDREMVVSMTDNSPVNACDDLTASFHSYYASGVGLVRQEAAYISEMQTQCAVRRRDLTTYYIAP